MTSINGTHERIATIERTRGWIFKKVDTFQIRGFIHDEWSYYPDGDEIQWELHDLLDTLVDEHTSEISRAHSVEFEKKQRLARWAAENKK